jgi:hypothetical protein
MSLTGLTLVLGCVVPAEARLTRLVMEHAESPAHQGRLCSETGPYQRLTGHAAGEPDRKDPLKAVIISNFRRATRPAGGNTSRRSRSANRWNLTTAGSVNQRRLYRNRSRDASFRWTAACISIRACDSGWEIREAMEHAQGRDDQFQRADEGAAEKVRLVEPWTRTSDGRIDYRFPERFSELGRNLGRGRTPGTKARHFMRTPATRITLACTTFSLAHAPANRQRCRRRQQR